MDKNTSETKYDDTFYEAIPYVGEHYIYRDDSGPVPLDIPQTDSNRRVAVVTLILVILVAAAAGLLLAWGISTLSSLSLVTSP